MAYPILLGTILFRGCTKKSPLVNKKIPAKKIQEEVEKCNETLHLIVYQDVTPVNVTKHYIRFFEGPFLDPTFFHKKLWGPNVWKRHFNLKIGYIFTFKVFQKNPISERSPTLNNGFPSYFPKQS